ncbi:MAG: hypothetical protein ACXWN4_01580 [Candidatus Limnocylindrales bacterium]
MSDRDQDQEEPLELNGLEPGEDEFEGEGEPEGEPEESEEEEGRPEAAPSRRRFGFGRGGQAGEETGHKGPTGSVREAHERIHVDDRASAVYALLAAAFLFGLLVVALAGNYVPQPVPATAPPLVVPTFNGTLPPSAAPSVSVAPSASPVASPTPAPSASPVASPSAT